MVYGSRAPFAVERHKLYWTMIGGCNCKGEANRSTQITPQTNSKPYVSPQASTLPYTAIQLHFLDYLPR